MSQHFQQSIPFHFTMRDYSGDINGSLWPGIPSNDADVFGVEGQTLVESEEEVYFRYSFTQDHLPQVQAKMAEIEAERQSLFGSVWDEIGPLWNTPVNPLIASDGWYISDEALWKLTQIRGEFGSSKNLLLSRFEIGTEILRCLQARGKCDFVCAC